MTDTTTDVAQRDDKNLDLLPAGPAARSAASIRLAQQVEDMALAAKFARSMCYTTAVPDIYRVGSKQNSDRKDDEVIGNAAAAIIYGNELGINASQSLQNIFSVGGRPAIYARTAVALLTARGYKISTRDQSDESVTVVGVAPDGRAAESTWTIGRATKAGYVPTVDEKTGEYRKNKWNRLIGNEKYLTDPVTMLKAKAQMEVCRDLAPDVLMGFAADDPDTAVSDDDQPRRVRNEAPAKVDAVAELRERLAKPAAIDRPAPAQSHPEPETSEADAEPPADAPKKPSAAQNRKLNALFEKAGLTKDDKAGRQIVFASFFPDRDLGAAPSADEVDHVISQLEQLDQADGDDVLTAYAEDVILQHQQNQQQIEEQGDPA